jgi:Zn-dependent peptidase ImmA (M78 family)
MAKTVKALITPEVLKWAREKRFQLEIDYAAKKSNVKPEQLAAWEAGTDKPTFVQLKRIAKVYRTHVSIFYLPEPPASFKPLTDHRELPEPLATDEKRLKELEDQVYRLNANVIEAYERRATLIEFYQLLGESPPQVTLTLSETDPPERAAQEIRDFLQFNTELLQQCNDDRAALKFWRQIVEERGILVCQTSVNSHLSLDLETVRGFCIAQKPLPVIVVNPKDSPYGRIFTIMHELVHIALGKSVIQNTELRQVRPPDNPTEVFCNEVAAEVLVPKDELVEIANLHTLETDLPQISKHFRVSPEVIMRRLLTLSYISRQKYQAYRKSQRDKHKDSSTPTGGGAPYHNRLLNTVGESFTRTAFTAYYEEKITLADLSDAFSKCDPKHLFEIESVIFA